MQRVEPRNEVLFPGDIEARDYVLHLFFRGFEEFQARGDSEIVRDAAGLLHNLPAEDQKYVIDNAVRWSRAFRDYLKKIGVKVPEERVGHAVK